MICYKCRESIVNTSWGWCNFAGKRICINTGKRAKQRNVLAVYHEPLSTRIIRLELEEVMAL